MEIITKYFPGLSKLQNEQFRKLGDLYIDWNTHINVISRKDIDKLYEHHILHSLAIAKVINFKPATLILDAGTGGGLPGIPLSILFPDCSFHLVDSINKKIRVVKAISDDLDLKNVKSYVNRVENLDTKFDFIVSRAVTSLPVFYDFVKNLVSKRSFNDIHNGILYLKGGDFKSELTDLKTNYSIYEIGSFFTEEFFLTKKLVHLY